jgi:imidazolonepropionase-like amidohydrolase
MHALERTTTARSKTRLGAAGLACLVALSMIAATAHASDNIPREPQSHPVLIRGGTVHTMTGEPLQAGQILFDKGRIKAVAAVGSPIGASGAEVIELKANEQVYPGLVDANTVIGLIEVGLVRATRDTAEIGTLNPNARAITAVNPDSELIPVTRSNGILTALVVPQVEGNGIIAGTSGLIELDGWNAEDFTVATPVGMHVFWPQMRFSEDLFPPPFDTRRESLQRQSAASLRLLQESFANAAPYAQEKRAGIAKTTDLRLEALIPVLEGKLPLFAHVQDIVQIRSALELAKRFSLKLVIVGGGDAWRVADELKARDIPVIVTGQHGLPLRETDSYDSLYSVAGKLARAGVRFCIAHQINYVIDEPQDRNLPYEAAAAVPFGLPHDEALKAITLYPAQILGVGDKLGSLEVGKYATLIVTNGDPLETATQVERAFIEGREVDLNNRQIELYKKYAERLRQMKDREKAAPAR